MRRVARNEALVVSRALDAVHERAEEVKEQREERTWRSTRGLVLMTGYGCARARV